MIAAGRSRLSVVTGTAGFLGAAVSRRLAFEGHRVPMMDVGAGLPEAEANRIGDAAVTMVTDITDPVAVESACESAFRELGIADILVDDAGVLLNSKACDTTPREWRRLMSVNLDGAHYVSRALLPRMRVRGFGRIVNICSLAMKTGGTGPRMRRGSRRLEPGGRDPPPLPAESPDPASVGSGCEAPAGVRLTGCPRMRLSAMPGRARRADDCRCATRSVWQRVAQPREGIPAAAAGHDAHPSESPRPGEMLTPDPRAEPLPQSVD